MGALSDAEGNKLSASVGALDQQMPEAEFESSLKDIMKTLYAKARASGLNVSSSLYNDADIVKGYYGSGTQGQNRDREAMAWANANPNDPRAMAILRANAR